MGFTAIGMVRVENNDYNISIKNFNIYPKNQIYPMKTEFIFFILIFRTFIYPAGQVIKGVSYYF